MYMHIVQCILTFIINTIVYMQFQVNPADYGHRIKNWAYKGFKELGDKGGCGLGSHTEQVIERPQFDKNPHTVCYIKFYLFVLILFSLI